MQIKTNQNEGYFLVDSLFKKSLHAHYPPLGKNGNVLHFGI